MKKSTFKNSIFSWLLVSMFFTSCSGQTTAELPIVNVVEQLSFTSKNTKLIKTQGTNEYQNIHCSIQDKAGNLWFGTTGEGVYRYDGAFFIQFTIKNGLNNNDVFSILEDRTGRIWFGTGDGVCCYDGKKITNVSMATSNNFYSANLVNNIPSASSSVHSIIQDRSGKIWFASSDGVYYYNDTFFYRFLNNDMVINETKLNLKSTQSIVEDKNGNIWFATWFEGLCRYDGKSITNFKPNNEVWYAKIFEDSKGNIWAGRRYKGICRYDGVSFTNVLQDGTFDASTARPLMEDKSGNIWFGSEINNKGEVWCFDGTTFKNFNTLDGLGNYGVWCSVEDSNGYIWFGTRSCGLYRYDGQSFTVFSE